MKILASDYDGTLKRVNGTVEKLDIEAIHTFREAGHKFGIVTGRSLDMLRRDFGKFDVKIDFFVGTNGGIIADSDYNKIISFDIDFNKAMDFMEKYRNRHDVSLAMGNGYKTARLSWLENTPDFTKFGVTGDYEEILESKIINSFVVGLRYPELRNQLIDEFAEVYGDYMNFHKNMNIIDVSAKGVYKSTGLEHVKSIYKTEELYVIGDELNDIEMIKKFKGYCVTNARAEVRECAAKIFDSVASCIGHVMNRP